jgi:hypothetical protein
MAQTLLEYAKNNPDPLTQAVVMEFAETSELLAQLPFANTDGGGVGYLREDALPGVGFRGINEAYDESVGILNPQFDSLTISGGDVDTDKFLVDQYGPERRNIERRMKVKALSLKWTKKFFKGDNSSDPREFDGLQRRLINSQIVYSNNSTATTGAALTLNKLDEVIDRVDNPTHILMNKTLRRRLSAAARNTSVGGFIQFSQNELGRRQMFYNDLPIVTVDYDELGAQILNFNEGNPDGSTGTNTSIYVISAGEGMLTGIQGGVSSAGGGDRLFGIRSLDLGLQTDAGKSVLRDRIEWYSGIATYHSRCAARLAAIADGTVAP